MTVIPQTPSQPKKDKNVAPKTNACELLFLFNTRRSKKIHPKQIHPDGITSRLDSCLVWDRGDSLWEVSLSGDDTIFTGLNWLPLQVKVGTLLLGRPLLLRVTLDTVDELSSTLGVVDMLDADVDTLLNEAVSDFLVDDNAKGGLCDVVDDTGLSVVDLVGHTVRRGEIKSAVLFIPRE